MVWGRMDEPWLMTFLLSRFVIAAAAFAIGVFVGVRFIRSKRKVMDGSAVADRDSNPSMTGGSPDQKIDALVQELKKARTALQDNDDINASMADAITELEDTVKRANGRLKLIEKSIKKSKSDL